jgi:hypothetical protein
VSILRFGPVILLIFETAEAAIKENTPKI